MLHERLPSSTSWHSRFSILIATLRHRLQLQSSLAAELRLFDLAYKELVSLFHGFLYVSVSYLQSPPAW